MSAEPMFKTTRATGESNAEVIVSLVKNKVPGDLVSFNEILQALDHGSSKRHTLIDARAAAARATVRLLKQESRALRSVRNVGYKVAQAVEHKDLALRRKERADTQMLRGLQTLQNVRWDEMDPQAKAAHEGTLLIVSALYTAQRALEARQRKTEALLSRVIGKVTDETS